MDKFRNLFRYRILPIYWVILTYMLLKPSSVKEEDLWINFINMDKIVHVFVFTVLGFCYSISFPKQKFVVFFVVMLVYAFLTELLQELMGLGRTMELEDFIADILGVLLGYIGVKKLNF